MALVCCGKKNPMYGKHHSKKTRLKMIKNHKGMTGLNHTEKTKQKMRNLWKKRIGTKKYKQYIKGLRERRLKQVFPRKDSLIEKLLQKELKKRKIKFKKHIKLIGQPDIFIEPNICIFCDGGYVHGDLRDYDWNNLTMNGMTVKEKHKYDNNINKKLRKQKYIVLRFWEIDIKKDIKSIGNKIEQIIDR